ncbi:MAG: c-type cytochrome domain-containing protein [Fimbriimonas sp.]
MKSKGILLATTALVAALYAQQQITVPATLEKHVSLHQAAKSLVAKVKVTATDGVITNYTLTYSKPSFLKIEGEEGFTVFDGKTKTVYTKASNTYTSTPSNAVDGLKPALDDEQWPWAVFFSKDPVSQITGIKPGARRTMAGVSVFEAALTLKTVPERSVRLFLDEKTGVARGFAFKSEKKDFIAFANDFKLSDSEIAPETFAFVAPAGAKLVEPASVEGPTYAMVQAIFNKACMPCHSSQQRKGTLDLSSYEAVMATPRAVVAGKPETSTIVRSITGDGMAIMPRNRPPLTKEEIATISNWMKNGAKK